MHIIICICLAFFVFLCKTQETQAINTSLVSSLIDCLSGPLAHTTGLCTTSCPFVFKIPRSSHLSTETHRSRLLESCKLSRFLKSSEDMWTATLCGAAFGIVGSSVWICLESRSLWVASEVLICLRIWSLFTLAIGSSIRKASSQSSVNVFRARQTQSACVRSFDSDFSLVESCLFTSGLSKYRKVYTSEQWICTGRNKSLSASRGNVTSAFWPQSNFIIANEYVLDKPPVMTERLDCTWRQRVHPWSNAQELWFSNMQVTTKESFWSSVLHWAATWQRIGGWWLHTTLSSFWEFRSKWQMLRTWFRHLIVLFLNSSCCFSTVALRRKKNKSQFSVVKKCFVGSFFC